MNSAIFTVHGMEEWYDFFYECPRCDTEFMLIGKDRVGAPKYFEYKSVFPHYCPCCGLEAVGEDELEQKKSERRGLDATYGFQRNPK